MKNACLWLLATCFVTLPALGQDRGSVCNPAGNQQEMNACAGDALQQAAAELDSVYREVLRRHAGDALFVKNLQEAQRRWIAFRDAELAAIFLRADDENPRTRYGSVFPMCHTNEETRLTHERIAQLRQWLDGLPEGDVCSGSRPMQQD